MNRRALLIVVAFIVTAASAAATRAQAAQPSQAAAPTQTTAQNPPANPAPSPTPQKKVWTNDELSALDMHGGVSTVGEESGNTPKHAVSTKIPAKSQTKSTDPKWYQDQIAKLQAKIPSLDSQIADLQAAIDGHPTGDARKSARPYSVKMDDWSRELAELQKKRTGVLAQIGALQDQARHNHVASNALP